MLTVKLLKVMSKVSGGRFEGIYIDLDKGVAYATNGALLVRAEISGLSARVKAPFRFVPFDLLEAALKQEKPGEMVCFDVEKNELVIGGSRILMSELNNHTPYFTSFERVLTPKKEQEFGFYAPQYLNLIDAALKAAGAGSLNDALNSAWYMFAGGRRGPLIIETGLHGITAALMPMAV